MWNAVDVVTDSGVSLLEFSLTNRLIDIVPDTVLRIVAVAEDFNTNNVFSLY